MTDAADRTITWERTGGKTHRVVVTDRALADENRRHWELDQAILQAYVGTACQWCGHTMIRQDVPVGLMR